MCEYLLKSCEIPRTEWMHLMRRLSVEYIGESDQTLDLDSFH